MGVGAALLLVFFLAIPAGELSAVERFPPPDFDSGYQLPETTQAAPRAGLYELLDVAALLAGLTLVSYLALRRRSRRGVFLVGLASLAYFGFWREGCVCSIGSIQNIALALAQRSYAAPLAVVAFFVLPLGFALFFGRTFCAGVCPMGAMQDLVSVRPIRVPTWLESGLGSLAYLYLGGAILFAATGSAFIICEYDPFVAFFRLSGSASMLLLGACILLIGLYVERPYCRYLCPYGALLNLVARAAKWHVTITPSECINCHLCADACPLGIIRRPAGEAGAPQPARTPHQRRAGLRRLAITLALLPVLAGLGAWAGVEAGPQLSRVHVRVRLAERIWLEDTARVEDTTDASAAFRSTGRPVAALYQEVSKLRADFALGGGLFGASIGLVFGIKLIRLSLRRRRVEYQIDRGGCVSCGRCFEYCPVGKEMAEGELLGIQGGANHAGV